MNRYEGEVAPTGYATAYIERHVHWFINSQILCCRQHRAVLSHLEFVLGVVATGVYVVVAQFAIHNTMV